MGQGRSHRFESGPLSVVVIVQTYSTAYPWTMWTIRAVLFEMSLSGSCVLGSPSGWSYLAIGFFLLAGEDLDTLENRDRCRLRAFFFWAGRTLKQKEGKRHAP
jgi:hypothetical protein